MKKKKCQSCQTMLLKSTLIIKKRYIKRRKKLNPKICYPELVGTNLIVDAASTNDIGTNLIVDAASTNDKCHKPVATVSGEKL